MSGKSSSKMDYVMSHEERTSNILYEQAKARIAELEKQLGPLRELEAERKVLQKMVDAYDGKPVVAVSVEDLFANFFVK